MRQRLRAATLVVLAGAVTACGGAPGPAAEPSAAFATCRVSTTPGSVELDTVTDGTLTVGVVLPNPGNWDGDSPDTIEGGFEYCLAAEIAHAAGLTGLELQQLSFEALVAGQARGYDLAMSGIFITDQRERAVDFSQSYYRTTSALLTRADTPLAEADLPTAVLGVYNGSVQQTWVDEELQPAEQPRTYQGTPDMVAALQAGQIDAALLDTPLMLTAASGSGGALAVVGQIDVGGDSGAVLPSGSPNVGAVDAVIDDLRDRGVLDELEQRYLIPAFGADPASIPTWSIDR